jgi:PAS domain S-box-containing protein
MRKTDRDPLTNNLSGPPETVSYGQCFEDPDDAELIFRELLEASPDGMVLVNHVNEILQLNSRVEKQFGYNRAELLGQKVMTIIPEIFTERLVPGGDPRVVDALAQQMGEGNELYGLRKDGSKFPVEILVRPLETSTGILAAMGISDASECKTEDVRLAEVESRHRFSENALKESEERYRMLLDGIEDYAIYLVDPQGQIISWNAGAERIKGYRADEIIGRNFSCFFPPEEIERGRPAEILRTAAACGRHKEQCMRVRKDGSQFLASVSFTALRDSAENLRGYSEFSHDISIQRLNADLERRVAERTSELATANKELEAFAYSVAHDLRAPLRHIDGFSNLLGERISNSVDESVRHYLESIQVSVRNMGLMVDDLLDLSRVARKELNMQVAGLNSLLEEVLRDLKEDLKDRNIEWRIGEMPFVECDPILVKQVFSNLLSNAVKFTRNRARAVIEVGQTSCDGVSASYVRDNGVGFSMKYCDKLFGVFQRLHRQEDFEGTGVGLATVQRIVRKHGGQIWAQAELNKGATFYFTIGTRAPVNGQIEGGAA